MFGPRHYLLCAIKSLLLELFIFSWTFLSCASVQQLRAFHTGRNFSSSTPVSTEPGFNLQENMVQM